MKIMSALLKVLLVDSRYFVAIGLRLLMIVVSEILYNKYDFVYTDIDYHVFSDGSKHMMNFESPYNRETYRYTPLLAFIMIPNHIINYNFGKVLLSFIDVFVGLLIEILLNIQNRNKNKNQNESTSCISDAENAETNRDDQEKSVFSIFSFLYSYVDNPYAYTSLLYLYNPFTINICTRGSADCIITLLVILTVILIEVGFFPMAGIVFGFAIHFKIYPIIYSPALYLYLVSKDASIRKILNEDSLISLNEKTAAVDKEKECIKNNSSNANSNSVSYYYNLIKLLIRKTLTKFAQLLRILLKSICNFRGLTFAVLTLITFLSFLFFFYIIYGNKFLYEYFFYHLVRKDHRHNYSIFYYMIYLTYTSAFAKFLSFLTFAPQILLIILSTLFLFQNINLCLLILTMVFVTFNKVVTAQYFLWYICLLPLVVPNNKLFDYKKHGGRVIYAVLLFISWLFLELIWNGYSHRLENLGENLFLQIWGINMAFFLVNCVIIKELIVSDTKCS